MYSASAITSMGLTYVAGHRFCGVWRTLVNDIAVAVWVHCELSGIRDTRGGKWHIKPAHERHRVREILATSAEREGKVSRLQKPA